ncbi:MAG: anfO [Firmicutes bacterium]|nr:anfO [Bacillota bacterium]
MVREIAVFCDAGGLTAALGEPGKITVFSRWQGSWKAAREKECFLDPRGGLKELRRQMAEAVVFLSDCRIFVAAAVTGVPYYELEKAGFSIWEYSGEPLGYLDQVWAREEKDTLAEKQPAVKPVLASPTEIAPGHFSISLKEIQQKNAGVTSKQVLLPFINRGHFKVLEVSCNHIPPWLEMALNGEAYSYTTERVSPNEVRVKISKVC